MDLQNQHFTKSTLQQDFAKILIYYVFIKLTIGAIISSRPILFEDTIALHYKKVE